MDKPLKTYCCSECNGTNIAIQAWVDFNTNKFITETENDTVWCFNCNKEVEIKPIE